MNPQIKIKGKSKMFRTRNPHEILVARKLQSEGYEVLRRGWPDFIAFNETSIRFIEVKSHKHAQMRPHQKRVSDIFRKFFGIKVEVICPNINHVVQDVPEDFGT